MPGGHGARPGTSEGVCARPGTAYVIPARVGVWLVWCSFWGPLVLESLSPPPRRAARARVSAFSGVRVRGRGPRGCVLLIEIYQMSLRT